MMTLSRPFASWRDFCATLGGLSLVLSACISPSHAPSTTPAAASNGASTPQNVPQDTPLSAVFSEGAWRNLHSSKHGLSLSLPEATQWRLQKERTWLSIEHKGTQSKLLVKHWVQGKLVNAKDCEAQALLWKTALVRPAVAALSEQALATPKGYQGHTWLYAAELPSGNVEGRLLAYAANIRDCFAFQFTTEAHGPHAASVVATRLSQVNDRLLPSLTVHSVEQRVERE